MQPKYNAAYLESQRFPVTVDFDLNAAVDGIIEFQGDFVLMDMQSTGFADLEFNHRAAQQVAPFRAYPGATVEGEFASVRVKAQMQPGKMLRLVLAAGYRFKPGNAQGRVVDQIGVNTQFNAFGNGAVGINVIDVVLSGNNLNGILLKHIRARAAAGAGGTVATSLFAYNPATSAKDGNAGSGKIMLMTHYNDTTTMTAAQEATLNRLIPAGWGLYVVESVGVAVANVSNAISWEVL